MFDYVNKYEYFLDYKNHSYFFQFILCDIFKSKDNNIIDKLKLPNWP